MIISDIPYNPNKISEKLSDLDMIIYSKQFKIKTIILDRILKNIKIVEADQIIYLGNNEDKLLNEICLRFANKNKVKKYFLFKSGFLIK